LRYANVGHDLPYLWHGGNAEELRARVMSLGLMLGMSYGQKEMVLEADEIALFYSDGLVEAHSPMVRCSAFLGYGRSSRSTARRRRWVTYFRRNFTRSPERAGSRRTTSPSLPYDVR
jgi:Stage II sporulation protein E (SpoIIE)